MQSRTLVDFPLGTLQSAGVQRVSLGMTTEYTIYFGLWPDLPGRVWPRETSYVLTGTKKINKKKKSWS